MSSPWDHCMRVFGGGSTVLAAAAAVLMLALPSSADDLANHPGKALYQSRGCFGCHGFPGEKQVFDTPNLAGQNKAYMQLQIRFIIEGSRRGLNLPAGIHGTSPMQSALSFIPPGDLEQILDYLSKLPLAKPVALTKPLSAEQAAEAKQIFERIGCASCHGLHGASPSNPEYPKIAGQTNTYLRRQLRNFRDKSRITGQSEVMQKNVHDLSDGQIELLADYISGFGGTAAP